MGQAISGLGSCSEQSAGTLELADQPELREDRVSGSRLVCVTGQLGQEEP